MRAVEDHRTVESHAGSDLRAATHRGAADEHRTGGHRRIVVHQALPAPAGQHRRGCDSPHQIRRAADEILRRSHIAPVAGVDESAHLGPGRQQAGEHLALHRHLPAAGDAFEDFAFEDVAPGVDLIGGRILGLFQECQYVSVGIGGHGSERTRVADPNEIHRDVGVPFAMGGQHRSQIHTGQHVAVEHHDGVTGQSRCDIGDSATGAQWPFLGDVLHLQAQCRTVAELRLERARLIGRSQDHVADSGLGDPGQQVGQERIPRGRQQRFGHRKGQRPQPGALAAHQHYRVDCTHRVPFANSRRDLRTAARARTPSAALIVHRSGACHRRSWRSHRYI